MNRWLCKFMGFTMLALISSRPHAEVLELYVPVHSAFSQNAAFFIELLTEAIAATGNQAKLVSVQLPQPRIVQELDSGELSINWMVATAERDCRYVPINIDLTNGLIGKRILFIRKGDQALYDRVQNLQDLQKLNRVAALGQGWAEIKIWQANQLAYQEQSGSWSLIFNKLAHSRDFDYFPRGANEILDEAAQEPELAIEKHLALIYDSDFHFYLSKRGLHAGIKYQAILSKALQQAKTSGLIDRLINKYWGNDLDRLDYKHRAIIHLKAGINSSSSSETNAGPCPGDSR